MCLKGLKNKSMNTKILRDKILQLAVQGKLVPQDPNDEPASVLLEKIKEEKERLITEGKLKKGKTLPPIIEDEIPFILPMGWKWVRLGEIVNFNIGKTPKRDDLSYWNNGIYPWVSIADIKDGEVLYITKEKVSEEAFKKVLKGSISPKGTLIMSFKLSIGKMAILGQDSFHNEAIISIYPFYDPNDLIKMYLFKIMKGLDILADTKSAVKGATLNSKSLNNIMIPFPPILEQKHIVEKVDESFALIGELDNNRDELIATINIIKNKILQEAVQGKLVPQDPNDEHASILLQKIKKEKERLIKLGKLKKEKPLPTITGNEIPYLLPKEWEWCRYGDVATYKKGPFGSSITKVMFVPKGDDTIKVYEQKNAINQSAIIGYYYITREKFESSLKGFEVFPNEIIVSCAGTIGKTYILPDVIEKGIINQALMKINLTSYVNNKFYLMFFDVVLNSKIVEKSNGSAMKNIPSLEILKKIVFPLPPLKEQLRIVQKVDYLMSLCDELEKKIKQSKKDSMLLMQSVLQEAFNGV